MRAVSDEDEDHFLVNEMREIDSQPNNMIQFINNTKPPQQYNLLC